MIAASANIIIIFQQICIMSKADDQLIENNILPRSLNFAYKLNTL